MALEKSYLIIGLGVLAIAVAVASLTMARKKYSGTIADPVGVDSVSEQTLVLGKPGGGTVSLDQSHMSILTGDSAIPQLKLKGSGNTVGYCVYDASGKASGSWCDEKVTDTLVVVSSSPSSSDPDNLFKMSIA